MPLDIAAGILLALYVGHAFGVPVTVPLILSGIGAALLPDIDAVTMLWGPWRHRGLTHYPLAYAPLVLLAYLCLGPAYATLLCGGVLAHLIHDTIGTGWGVSWLWPATRRRFLFFPGAGRMQRHGWFITFQPEEQDQYPEDPLLGGWVRHYYLRPSRVALIEYGALLLALLALALATR